MRVLGTMMMPPASAAEATAPTASRAGPGRTSVAWLRLLLPALLSPRAAAAAQALSRHMRPSSRGPPSPPRHRAHVYSRPPPRPLCFPPPLLHWSTAPAQPSRQPPPTVASPHHYNTSYRTCTSIGPVWNPTGQTATTCSTWATTLGPRMTPASFVPAKRPAPLASVHLQVARAEAVAISPTNPPPVPVPAPRHLLRGLWNPSVPRMTALPTLFPMCSTRPPQSQQKTLHLLQLPVLMPPVPGPSVLGVARTATTLPLGWTSTVVPALRQNPQRRPRPVGPRRLCTRRVL